MEELCQQQTKGLANRLLARPNGLILDFYKSRLSAAGRLSAPCTSLLQREGLFALALRLAKLQPKETRHGSLLVCEILR